MIIVVVVADAPVDVASPVSLRLPSSCSSAVAVALATVAPPRAFSLTPGVALAGAVIAPRAVAWPHPSMRHGAGHETGRGVFALVFVRSSFTELPIAHEALSRQVVALVVGVNTLEKVVAAAKELA